MLAKTGPQRTQMDAYFLLLPSVASKLLTYVEVFNWHFG